jgi:uncharacterized damage-inducible protein DinB
MDIDTVQLFARYNEKTNVTMNGHISKISEAQWNTNFNAYFPSIYKICNHLYIADFNWLQRFSKLRNFGYANDKIFTEEIKFTMEVFKTQDEHLQNRNYLDKIINRFADDVTKEDFKSELKYKDSKGTDHNRNFGGLVMQMFNHQIHHRGMISVYLEMLGVENDYANLHLLV